jgi:hypothetical protein
MSPARDADIQKMISAAVEAALKKDRRRASPRTSPVKSLQFKPSSSSSSSSQQPTYDDQEDIAGGYHSETRTNLHSKRSLKMDATREDSDADDDEQADNHPQREKTGLDQSKHQAKPIKKGQMKTR